MNAAIIFVDPKKTKPLDYRRPRYHTPKHFFDKILTTRSSIEGEHKIITLTFAAVVNSTAIFEHFDPEDVHKI